MSDERMPERKEPAVSDAVLAVFSGVVSVEDPTAIVLVGGPGAVPARAVGRLLAAAPHPVAYVNGSDLAALSGRMLPGDRVVAVNEAVRYAQRNMLPVIVDDEPTAAAPGPTLAAFKEAGFRTRLVVTTHREVEAAMSSVTRRLMQQLTMDRSPVEAPNAAGWARVVEALSAVDPKLIDDVTILDGDGAPAYEGPVRRAAWDAVRKSVRAPMPGAQGVLWLGELRRVTDYVVNAGAAVTADDRKRVVSLYDLAGRRVLPELPIDRESKSFVAQRELLKRGRSAVEAVVSRAEQTAVGPQTPGVGGPSRQL